MTDTIATFRFTNFNDLIKYIQYNSRNVPDCTNKYTVIGPLSIFLPFQHQMMEILESITPKWYVNGGLFGVLFANAADTDVVIESHRIIVGKCLELEYRHEPTNTADYYGNSMVLLYSTCDKLPEISTQPMQIPYNYILSQYIYPVKVIYACISMYETLTKRIARYQLPVRNCHKVEFRYMEKTAIPCTKCGKIIGPHLLAEHEGAWYHVRCRGDAATIVNRVCPSLQSQPIYKQIAEELRDSGVISREIGTPLVELKSFILVSSYYEYDCYDTLTDLLKNSGKQLVIHESHYRLLARTSGKYVEVYPLYDN